MSDWKVMTDARNGTGRAPWIVTAVLSAVAIALTVTIVVFHLPSRHGRHAFTAAAYGALTSSEQQAVAAAKQTVINTMSYRRSSFPADFARTLAGTTGTLQTDMRTDGPKLLKEMTAGKFDLSASVSYAAFEAHDGAGAVVLVSATGYKVTSAGQVPASAERLAVTMVQIKGKWLASDLQSVGLT